MYTCIYGYMYTCICVYMFICIYVYMYRCIYVYMFICIYVNCDSTSLPGSKYPPLHVSKETGMQASGPIAHVGSGEP